jgi:hypothetical protein
VTATLDRPKMRFRVKIGAALLDNPNKHAPLHEKIIRVEQGSIIESDIDLVARFGEKFERIIDDELPRGHTPAQWTDEELAHWGLTRAASIQQVTVNPVAQAAREGFASQTQAPPTKLAPSMGDAKDNFEVMTEKELRDWAKVEGIDLSPAAEMAKRGKTPPEKTEKYHIVRILQAAVKEE